MKAIQTLTRTALGGIATLVFCATAFAQSENWVEGTIVDVDVSNQTGTLTIEDADSGDVENYAVTPTTKLTVKDQPGSILPRSYEIDSIDDLREGDVVKLDLSADMDGRYSVRTLERDSNDVARDAEARMTAAADSQADMDDNSFASNADNQRNQAATVSNSADYDYDALPSTASAMPWFAIVGLFSLLSGVALRIARS